MSEDKKTILIVEDEPGVVAAIRFLMEQQGYNVRVAEKGEDALDLISTNKPHLVLLDIMMSYILDGLDVSREMAEDPQLKDIPVIMVTSLTGVKGSGMLPTDEYIPVDEWLSKPVDPETLVDRVSSALA